MLDKANSSSLADLLSVIGPAGTLLGAAIATTVRPARRRDALERLALGAALGGVIGYLAAFVVYDLRLLG
jgi:zinc transporter ZupT